MAPPIPISISPPADDAELLAFERLASQALLVPPSTPPGWTLAEGRENFRLARLGRRLVAGLGAQRIGQWFGGRPVATAAVRAVAVAPEVRARGIAGALLRATFEDLRAAGIPLSTLYPATHVLYRRAGYELAGSRLAYRVSTQTLGSWRRDLEVGQVERASEAPFVEACRERARRSNGHLERNRWLWRRLLEPPQGPEPLAYVVGRDGLVLGYAILQPSRAVASQRGEILVRDLVVNSREAAERILALLADHRSIVDSVAWYGGQSDPLLRLLDNPTARVEERWDWMLRLVDVEAALVARGYPLGLESEVHLDVRDDVLGWNHGRFVLFVAKGEGRVTRGGEGRVRIDVRSLAQLYSGYLSPLELAARSEIDGEEIELHKLMTIFAGPSPWMSDFF